MRLIHLTRLSAVGFFAGLSLGPGVATAATIAIVDSGIDPRGMCNEMLLRTEDGNPIGVSVVNGINPYPNPMDEEPENLIGYAKGILSHGTGVASIAAQVYPQAKLVSVRIGDVKTLLAELRKQLLPPKTLHVKANWGEAKATLKSLGIPYESELILNGLTEGAKLAEIINLSAGYDLPSMMNHLKNEGQGVLGKSLPRTLIEERAKELLVEILEKIRKIAVGHPDRLFIFSSGNSPGKMQDLLTVPCVAQLPNTICVGGYQAGPNHQASKFFGTYDSPAIDFYTRATRLRGERLGSMEELTGTSYSAPQIAALAAKLLDENPAWKAPELKQDLIRRSNVRRLGIDRPPAFSVESLAVPVLKVL